MAGNFKLSIDELSQRLSLAEEELGKLRKIVTRAYEDTPRAGLALLSARRDPHYSKAYGPEPLVSVRIGAYRGGDVLFDRALTSVRGQTYRHLEIIVVCDGLDGETVHRIDELEDPRVIVVQRPRNGPYPHDSEARWQVAGSHPFNQAVAMARGSWIAPIDQDDKWVDDHLEKLLDRARESRAELVYGVGRVVLDDGTETYFGAWPPVLGDFGFQTAIYHAGLTGFLYDANSHLFDEPADWNLARRMLEAGVTFDFLERIVTAYFVYRDERGFDWWKARQQERGAYAPEGDNR